MSDEESAMAPIDLQTDDWRWYYRFVGGYITVVFLLIGLALAFGPGRWTSGNSLQNLHDHTLIPWPAWGALFVTIGLGIRMKATRLAAYFVGLCVAIFFVSISILFSVIFGKFTNPITILFATLSVPMLLAGMRYSVIVDGPPKRRST